MKNKKIIAAAGCIIAITIILVGTRFLSTRPVMFEQTKWNQLDYSSKGLTIRQRMVDDLIEHVLTDELSRKDIEEMLGSADKYTGSSTWIDQFQPYELLYYLGPERGNRLIVDSEWLFITLDENDRYNSAVIATD